MAGARPIGIRIAAWLEKKPLPLVGGGWGEGPVEGGLRGRIFSWRIHLPLPSSHERRGKDFAMAAPYPDAYGGKAGLDDDKVPARVGAL